MPGDYGPRSFTFKVSTTAPGVSATVVVFDSTLVFGGAGRMRHLPIARVSFAVNNSHAFTLDAKRSTDNGATWTTFSSTSIGGAPAANTITGPYDYLIDCNHEFQLVVVNGADAQTTWTPEVKGHENRQPGT